MKRRTPFTAAGLAALVALVGCTPSAEQASTETSVTTPAPVPAPAPTPSTPAAAAPIATPLLARVLAAPVPVPATDGRTHLVYELLLTNSMNQNITVDAVVVRPGDGDPLLTLAGAELADRTRVLGTTAPTAELGPSQSALVWLDVITENGRTPTELDHQVQVTLTQPMPPLLPAEVTETVAPVTVQTREPVSIAAPLRGPQWWDANGCCGMTPHRMAINPIDGELWGAERFAIDYVQLMPDGRLFDGKVDDLSGYPYFGADIHAVADGPVVAVLDGLPEQVPGVNPTGLRLDEYGGNHVVQDIGGGNYAFYAHLKTGSVAVKPGDRLSTGQVLGQLGNSGNTDAPHLHFHVMDGPDPLKADGLPFVIDAFRLTARTSAGVGPDGDAIDTVLAGKPAPLQPDVTPRDETMLAPLVSDVMDYADE